MKEQLLKKYNELFPQGSPRVFAGPGRVNLIGGHTDYNLGFVLPTAVDKEILLAVENRTDDLLKLYSLDYNEGFETGLDNLKYNEEKKWANYLMGVFHFLKESGFKLKGMNIVFGGNIPQGGGMSSSAALEVGTAYAVREMQGLKLGNIDLVKICQKAENKFVGVMCGIMDQFASAMSKKDKLIFLDCADLSYKFIPLDFSDISFFIADTKKERTLAGSEYNKRREECTLSVEVLKKHLPGIRALRDVSPADFEKYKDNIPLPARKRAEHIVYEIDRVVKGVKALENNDIETFGKLQRATHVSMRDLFEVSCYEIDQMVEIANSVKGVYGSFIIGGGFGGCTISVVENSVIPELKEKLMKEYPAKTGKTPEFWVCNSSDGAREIK